MKQLLVGNTAASRRDEYTSAEEFCSMFMQNMDRHGLLALLLTGSEVKAVECVTLAVEDCQKSQVFKPWANSWARLSVIERAMRIVGIASRDSAEIASDVNVPDWLPLELGEVMKLGLVQRFVYVLTVLEKYSIRDAAILLKRGRREVMEARQKAMSKVSSNEAVIGPLVPQARPATLIA